MVGVARNFFVLALFHALCGMALGLFMGISEDHTAMPAHAHILAAGWLMSAVFAFFYHLFPEVARTTLAQVHFWLTAASSIAMFGSLIFLFYGETAAEPVVAVASSAFYAAIILFVFVSLPVLRAAPAVKAGALGMKAAVDVASVAIIGNGLMGQGIAQVFARAGKAVRLIGRNETSLAKAMTAIRGNFQAFVARGLAAADETEAALQRISTSTHYEDAAGADHVIEAVPAERELQREVFARLDRICAPAIVLGSTSGQPISLMVDRMRHKERAVAMHFIYPAQLISLVEVCGGPKTAPDVVAWACDLLIGVGQTPALMNKEVDGFIVNRLQFAVLREAWSMWANGIASAEAIDRSFKMTLGRRYSITGPIESAELGGLDIMHKFAEFLFPDIETAKHPPEAVTELVHSGNYGLKTGRGIYDWSKRDGKALLAARADRLFEHRKDDAAKP